jgi:hypothetical protein
MNRFAQIKSDSWTKYNGRTILNRTIVLKDFRTEILRTVKRPLFLRAKTLFLINSHLSFLSSHVTYHSFPKVTDLYLSIPPLQSSDRHRATLPYDDPVLAKHLPIIPLQGHVKFEPDWLSQTGLDRLQEPLKYQSLEPKEVESILAKYEEEDVEVC